MARRVLLAALVVAAATSVAGDVYMHNPRGSNNRLNEQSAARTNGNRLFNSQNNNRGGYNVGDRGRNAYNANDGAAGSYSDPAITFDRTKNVQDVSIQYQMQYFEGSELTFEWTNQHGCGGSEADDPSKLNCDLLIQYMCQTTDGLQDPQTGMLKTPPKTKAGRDQIMGAESLRDGTNTNTPNTLTALTDGATITTNLDKGHHESEAYYFECQSRSRNRGLFLADQNMGGNSARFTRQNNNGNRNGLECPEERDYYPYWSPSPWKDVVLMTDRPQERCDAGGFYNGASQNNHDVYKCVIAPTATTLNAAMAAITQAACEQAQGTWTAFQHGIAPPRCEKAQWSRVNHLGNGRDGNPLRWTWHLPSVQDLVDQGAYQYTGPAPDNAPMVKCVARLRYNISTDDFDPDKTDYQYNQNNAYKKTNPITGNPVVDIGAGPMPWQGLQLNVNTAQFARTFQDRSHIFYIRKRPASIPSDAKIYNLNVRGKRGNIVQTFPAVEYDFIPNQLTVTPNDYVHVQWTGSNTHNNGNPGGDGQTGDAGEGRTGTDRHNMAQMLDRTRNYPLPLDKFPDNMWSRSTCYNPDGTPFSSGSSTPGDISQNRAALDCAIYMTTSGQFVSYDDVNTAAQGNKLTFDPLLDDAPASLIGGILMKFQPDFTANGGQDKVDYHYMNTRNNNFSNRGQRGTITVVPT